MEELREFAPDRVRAVGPHQAASSLPSRMKISVGHSLMPKERPSGRPLASSILRWRSGGTSASALASSGCAALQMPHQGAPNSMSVGPERLSTSLREGSTVA